MTSSTQIIPGHTDVPQHICVVMDGNGRWAKKRLLPRVLGHKKGVTTLENMAARCSDLGVRYLTVFAFSTENWRRPADERRADGPALQPHHDSQTAAPVPGSPTRPGRVDGGR